MVMSGLSCRYAYGPADATALAPENPDWFYLPGFTFLVPSHPGGPGQSSRGPQNGCVCVCVCVCGNMHNLMTKNITDLPLYRIKEVIWNLFCSPLLQVLYLAIFMSCLYSFSCTALRILK